MCDVLKRIGKGSFGSVYLLQIDTTYQYALKVVSTRDEKCYREALLLMKLQHPHLVQCCDAFEASGNLYLVTELCLGGSLYQCLQYRRCPFSEKCLLLWFFQLTDCLRYLHALRVIHRDLKPGNIFLDDKKHLKVGDLGVSRQMDHTDQDGTSFVGSQPYMSPEVLSYQPYGFKADIWSLGCCMHELMTLKKTISAVNVIRNEIPEMPDVYSDSLRSLVLCLLKEDPEERPDTLEILHHLQGIQRKKHQSNPIECLQRVNISYRKLIVQAVQQYEQKDGDDVILPIGFESYADFDHTLQNQGYAVQGNVVSNLETVRPKSKIPNQQMNVPESGMDLNGGFQPEKERKRAGARPLPIPKIWLQGQHQMIKEKVPKKKKKIKIKKVKERRYISEDKIPPKKDSIEESQAEAEENSAGSQQGCLSEQFNNTIDSKTTKDVEDNLIKHHMVTSKNSLIKMHQKLNVTSAELADLRSSAESESGCLVSLSVKSQTALFTRNKRHKEQSHYHSRLTS